MSQERNRPCQAKLAHREERRRRETRLGGLSSFVISFSVGNWFIVFSV
ncbi:unnamed protein product [Schistosoma margrebowiei]|uniref:Uncharacterized protein n=1 Tax=Schistosoma margrebowiei TaxID=48269 RepID=A0A3P8F7B4_9TREM|nr:unnamed protein product [Schistosoma margrebowiei]